LASFALKRILVAVLVAFTVSVVSFTVLRLSADLAQALAGEGASSEQVEQIRISYGLDRPLALQYLDWLGNIIRGDLGESY
jgi:peptide/nickel transport system permease protein